MKKKAWRLITVGFVCIGMVFTSCAKLRENTGYSWKIEPKFAYNNVFYDAKCRGFFAADSEREGLLDSETGEFTDEEHFGHGGGNHFLAVNNQGIYGTYHRMEGASADFEYNTLEDAFAQFEDAKDFKAIALFDTDKNSWGFYDEEMNETNVSIQFAYTYRKQLITEYCFDDVDSLDWADNPAVCKIINGEEKWGFINSEGEQVIGFIFDGAASINQNTAFVKQDGKWGIIYKNI